MNSKRLRVYSTDPDVQQQNVDEVKFLVSGLNQAVTMTHRCRVLNKMLLNSPVLASSFIQADALQGLCLQLGFLLNQPCNMQEESNYSSPEIDQILMICRVLDAFYQHCSDHIREASLLQIGSELLNILLQVWKQNAHFPNLVRRNRQTPLLSIWRSISLFSTGSLLIVQHEEFLQILQRILVCCREDEENEKFTSSLNQQHEELALTILKHMSAHAENYRLVILEQFGSILSKLALLLYRHQPSLERLASIFHNLAMTSNVRLAMVEHSHIISALLQLLLLLRNKGQSKMHDVRTIRTILCTINSLCLERNTRLQILLHGEGILLGILLQYLLSRQIDDVVRRRSARALRLLAQCNATANILLRLTLRSEIGDTNNFLASLHQAALYDPCLDVRGEATIAYTKCITCAFFRKHLLQKDIIDELNQILDKLAELANQVPTAAPEALSKTFQELVINLSTEEQSNNIRTTILRHDTYIKAVTELALCSNASYTTCTCIASTLVCLALDKSLNCDLLVTEPILKCLVHIASDDEFNIPSTQEQQETANQALLELASNTSRLKQLATHGGLLSALIRYTTNCIDETAKQSFKTTLLSRLIPQL